MDKDIGTVTHSYQILSIATRKLCFDGYTQSLLKIGFYGPNAHSLIKHLNKEGYTL
jgi:hypothetical protein